MSQKDFLFCYTFFVEIPIYFVFITFKFSRKFLFLYTIFAEFQFFDFMIFFDFVTFLAYISGFDKNVTDSTLAIKRDCILAFFIIFFGSRIFVKKNAFPVWEVIIRPNRKCSQKWCYFFS